MLSSSTSTVSLLRNLFSTDLCQRYSVIIVVVMSAHDAMESESERERLRVLVCGRESMRLRERYGARISL